MEKTLSFLHSGDMGDIIAGLASVKEICERENAKAEIHLDTSGGMKSNVEPEINAIIRQQSNGRGLKFSYSSFTFLKPLIEAQPYVSAVYQYIPGTPVDFNLNRFRLGFANADVIRRTNLNLMFLHQVALGLPMGYRGPWMTVEPMPEPVKVIVARSSRYQSGHVVIASLERDLVQDGGFIGTDFEHKLFEDCFGWAPTHIPVRDALDAAREIAGSETIVVNGTLFYWIAVAIGHPDILHELAVDIPTTFFPGADPAVRYFTGARFLRR